MYNMFDELQKYLLYYNVNFFSPAIDKKRKDSTKGNRYISFFLERKISHRSTKKTLVLVKPRI